MAKSSRSGAHPFNKIILVVFGIAFGLVALVFAYQAVVSGSDIRSRAAQARQIYKQWEFNGSTTEGWSGVPPYSVAVKSGLLRLLSPDVSQVSSLPALRDTGVNLTLPTGLKTVSMYLAVSPAAKQIPVTSVRPVACPVIDCNGGTLIEVSPGSSGAGAAGNPANPGRGNEGNSNPGASGKTATVVCPEYKCVTGNDVVIDDTGFGLTDQVVEVTEFDQTIAGNLGCPADAKLCPDGTVVGRSGVNCTFDACSSPLWKRKFVGMLYYKLKGHDKFEAPVKFSGNADGSFQNISVNLRPVEAITLERIRIVFLSGVKNNDTVSVDWIRILGASGKVTPRPTPITCNYNVKPPKVCPTGYRCQIPAIEGGSGTGTCTPVSPTCVPLPKCATEGTLDKNGRRVYCDLQVIPGTKFCPVTPKPSPKKGCICPDGVNECPKGNVKFCPVQIPVNQ